MFTIPRKSWVETTDIAALITPSLFGHLKLGWHLWSTSQSTSGDLFSWTEFAMKHSKKCLVGKSAIHICGDVQ